VAAAAIRPQRSTLGNPIHHVGGCGLRIPSPHPECQAWAGSNYNAAELRTTTLSSGPVRVRVVWLVCHGCGQTVQRSESAA
jgi:hypothetical protein